MISEGNVAHPVQQDPFQMIVNVHWANAPVIVVDIDGQTPSTNAGSPQFTEDPPFEYDGKQIITADKYKDYAYYDPFGNAGIFVRLNYDLIYIVYVGVTILDPDLGAIIKFHAHNEFVGRIHRAFLINMAKANDTIQIDWFSQVGNNYLFIFADVGGSGIPPTGAYPIRLMQGIDNNIKISAYNNGTEFKTASEATIVPVNPDLKPIWSFSETVTIDDDRPAPAGTAAAVEAYNLIGDDPPFPFATLKFNKDGKVSFVVGGF